LRLLIDSEIIGILKENVLFGTGDRRVFMSVSDLIVIGTVRVDRTQDVRAALAATGRVIHRGDDGAIAAIPRGEGDEVEVLGFYASCSIYESKRRLLFRSFELEPDPRAQIALNNRPALFGDEPSYTFYNGPDHRTFYCQLGKWSGEVHDKGQILKKETPPYVDAGPFTCDRMWSRGWFLGVRRANLLL